MMRYSLLYWFAICCIISTGSTFREVPLYKKLISDYVFVPSGNEGDSVVPEFYISAIEVSNRQYRDFIQDLTDSGATAKLHDAMVDTLLWASSVPSHAAFVHYYFQDRAYDAYPVVNISRRGAELYCEWLTDRYNRSSRQKVRFMLPTALQWTYAARGGNPRSVYPWPGESVINTQKGKWRGMPMCNFRADSTTDLSHDIRNDTADITAPCRSFIPNTYEIYNMGGNVAEMISEGNFTKGGSYLSPAGKLLISAHEEADLSRGAPGIGFRPVMVYVR